MKTVALPIENKVREFDGRLWLGLNFVERGYEVVIGPSWEIKPSIDIIEPDIYFAKDAGDGNVEFFKGLKESGVLVCGLPPEGLPPLKWYAKNKGNALEVLDMYFAWGEAQTEFLKSKYDVNNTIKPTGNPRFDLLMDKMRDFYKQGSKSITDEYSNYVLFNMNFGRANPIDRESQMKMLKRNFPDRDVVPEEKFIARNLYYMKELVVYLSEKLDMDVIVRPHPGENHSVYKKELAHYHDIHIEHSGDVRPWIYASSGVIHYDCTTGIETSLMKTPVLSYQPFVNMSDEFSLTQYLSIDATTHEGVINWTKEFVKTESQHVLNEEQKEKLNKYFANTEELAAPRICNIVENSGIKRKKKDRYNVSTPKKLEMHLKSSVIGPHVLNVYDSMRKISGQDQQRLRQKQYQKFPGLREHEIMGKFDRLSQYIDIEDINVEKLSRTNYSYKITAF
jgi:surface carbohydrate biosynthesis protein